MKWAGLAAIAALMGCVPEAELRATSPMAVQANGLEASVAGLRAVLENTPDAGPRTDQVEIHVANRSAAPLHFHPERVRLVELGADVDGGVASSAAPPPSTLGSPVTAGIAGAQAGASLGGASPGGAALGGLAGASAGLAVGAAVLLPVAVYVLVDEAVERAKQDMKPGDEATFHVRFEGPSLDDGKRYALALSDALEQPPDALPPLELVDPADAHRGYGEPSERGWYLEVHLGGGTLHDAAGTSGLGGIELGFGVQHGPLGVGLHGTAGIGSDGADLRWTLRPASWLAVTPYASYALYLLPDHAPQLGHGPLGGVELSWIAASDRRFGWDFRVVGVGLYAEAGPVFLGSGVARELQLGLGVDMP